MIISKLIVLFLRGILEFTWTVVTDNLSTESLNNLDNIVAKEYLVKII